MKVRNTIIMLALGCASLYAQQKAEEAWVRHYSVESPYRFAVPTALALDKAGNAFIAGISMDAKPASDYLTLAYSPDGQFLWKAIYNGPANKDDETNAIAVDEASNVYVTGESERSNDFTDYATVKYNSAGNQQWVARYSGATNGINSANAIAVDVAGNVYVTGASLAAAFPGGFDPDYATVKCNANGEQQWVARYDGPGQNFDGANAIAVDAAGNVYVTGMSYGRGTGPDYATIKYNAKGEQQWVSRYNGPANSEDFAVAIAVDPSGNVYVTGVNLGLGTASDYATIKYNSAGVEQWVARYNSSGNVHDVAEALAIDAEGNVYVTGTSGGVGTTLDPHKDFATVKYNNAGVQQWVARYNGPGNSWDIAKALALDGSGNVYVTGQSVGSGTASDYATIKYTSAGQEQWVARYNSQGNKSDGAEDIAVDAAGNVYVTGATDLDDASKITTIKYRQSPLGARPTLVSPLNDAKNQPVTLTLRWNTFQGASSYHLQLATDPLFGQLIRDDSAITDTLRQVGPLTNSKTYYWRVKANKGGGEETDYSEVWRFTTIIAAPAAPVLASPANGATNQPTTLTLNWNEVAGAETYRLQLSTDPAFGTLILDDSTITALHRTVGPLAADTKYYWRAKAKNVGGTSNWSETWNFTTAATPIATSDIAGKVSYCPTNGPVEDVTLTLSGGASGIRVTDANGGYRFEKLSNGLNYSVTPSKTDDIAPLSISVFDAALIALKAFGLKPASHCDSLAADVDKDGKITFFDAALTCRFALEFPHFGPSDHTGEWRFEPVSRSYAPLTSDQAGQDYVAALLGDVDGNWKPASQTSNVTREMFTETYEHLTDLAANTGKRVHIPIIAKASTGILSADIDFEYDPAVLQFVEVAKTALSEKLEVLTNAQTGRLRVGAYGTQAVMESGELLVLTFEVIGKEGTRSPLALNRYQINDGPVQLANAEFVVAAATANIPKQFALGQNYPNPFNPGTYISFGIPQSSGEKVKVRLAVYNIFGQLVRVLVDEEKAAGSYEIQWDGRNDAGATLPSGMYFYTITAGDFRATKKMVMLR